MSILSAEANVLHAALEEDRDRVKALLLDFYPGELLGLREACRTIILETYAARSEEVQDRFDAKERADDPGD